MTTKVKICGIKTEDALEAALEAGADYVGLVFCEKSPRNLDIGTAKSLSRRAHERSQAQVVTLLVDADDALIDQIAYEVRPDLIQLHGSETPERAREIQRRTRIPVMKAIPVATESDVAAAGAYLEPGGRADLVLFDAKPPKDPAALPGGNGLAFDWRILDGVKGHYPFALAGGLTPDNVADAIRLTGASVVDVSSGVESAPGVKDPELIRRFLRAAKAAKQTNLPSSIMPEACLRHDVGEGGGDDGIADARNPPTPSPSPRGGGG